MSRPMPTAPPGAGPDQGRSGPLEQFLRPGIGADLCRVTVHGSDGRADLAIPTVATIGRIIPVVAGYVSRGPASGQMWVLQRLGELPLNPDDTPETADLHDGDVLHLRSADDAIPELQYDDLSEGVAETIAARTDRWRPETTRRTLITLAVFAEVLLALLLVFGTGAGVLASCSALVIAVVLGGSSVAV
ncbi:MAG: type secretion integral rane protein EccD, partial [Mycobacterium sp.]|nr:type secretion integral rane protein EccD [Mycobacterium sp.]